jgi:hypothetical protein
MRELDSTSPLRGNPQDSEWLDATFTFYDVGPDDKPKLVTRKTWELLDPRKLGYVYDKLETLPAPALARAPVVITGQSVRIVAATPRPDKLARPPGTPHGGMSGTGIRLGNTASKTVPVPLAAGVTPAAVRTLLAGKPAETGELVLSLEGVEFDQLPGVFYDVYLEVPAADTATPASRHYLGSLTFFGLAPHGAAHGRAGTRIPRTIRFVVAAQLRKAIVEKKLDPRELKVTFVPQTGTEPIRKGAPLKAPLEWTAVTIQQLRLAVAR